MVRRTVALFFALVAIIVLLYPAQAQSPPAWDGLASFWKLEEAEATRYDCMGDCCWGTNHLTDNNTVGRAVGQIGYAADFVAANGECLTSPDSPDLSAHGDFTIATWLRLTSKSEWETAIAKWAWTINRREYCLGIAADRFVFLTSADGSDDVDTVYADNLGSPALGQWYFVVVWYDAISGTNNIQVNNGEVDSGAARGVLDSDSIFSVGCAMLGSGPNMPWDGEVDAVGLWQRVLTAEEREYLWNDGNGREYPCCGIAATPIPATPTPDPFVITGTLSSGAPFWVERSFSYGQIGIALSVLGLVALGGVWFVREVVRR